ncbi:MAG TPA: hypothetical protein VNL14_00715 [Candidatus Acidoferrales bacterium]|nr:hypothetical protein [Candidatus Acidoferrales bacterium]
MGETQYGGRKTLYGVVEKPDGGIEVRVYHDNALMRRVIQANRTNPRYFVEHCDTYKESPISAQFWMAQIVCEYRFQFENNRVSFVFAKNVPPPSAGTPEPDTVTLDDLTRWRRDIIRLLGTLEGRSGQHHIPVSGFKLLIL